MTDADPERLLAEALRAQAAQAPRAEAPAFGLLSGSEFHNGHDLAPRPVEVTERLEERSAPSWWVLAVALLLGLAAGAVVGLLTLV
ncbi:hypothetical protein ACTG9Q_02455 [Actinokineospora sp. 24-640]